MVCKGRLPRLLQPLVLAALCTHGFGCDEGTDVGDSGASREASATADAGAEADVASPDDGGDAHGDALPELRASDALQACADDWQGQPAPATIDEALARINAMTKPVTISCFVASLPRPLHIVATDSVFSAQPANGRESPRVFLLSDTLILSVVPDGVGGHLLEFGEFVSKTRTVKGEIAFPVTGTLAAMAPYDHLLEQPNLTSCGFCHRVEEPHPTLAGVFVSDALKPEPSSEVPLTELLGHAAGACDPGASEERCAMMQALFALGPVEQGQFDPELPGFFL